MTANSIHDACRSGDLDLVQELVANDPSVVNADDEHNWRPIFHAGLKRHTEVVRFLISAGADVSAHNGDALHYAGEVPNNKPIVELLILHGALDPHVRPTSDLSRQFLAALFLGDSIRVESMLRDSAKLANTRDGSGQLPIHHAARNGDLPIVRLLVEAGADVNTRAKNGHTVIYCAGGHGHLELVEYLLEQGADPSVKFTKDGKDLLEWLTQFPDDKRFGEISSAIATSPTFQQRAAVEAIKDGDAAKLKESLDSDAQLLGEKIRIAGPTNHAIGKDATLLQLASLRTRKGDDTSAVLLERGAKLDLHSACGLGMVDEIKEILDANPQAFGETVDTYYPLQYAITAARVESLDYLMRQGDDPNRDLKKVAYFGWEDEVLDQQCLPWKPIHMASLWGFDAKRVPVAECLARHGANLNAISPLDGFKPIHLVAMPNRVDMIRFFVENGVDVDSRSEEVETFSLGAENDGPMSGYGNTALMVACAEGFIEATKCLVELGADVKAKNNDGLTPLDFARRRCWNGQPYDEIIEFLG